MNRTCGGAPVNTSKENIMTTAKQIRARRTSANKSTGPLTGQGKARAAKNALQHELRARERRANG